MEDSNKVGRPTVFTEDVLSKLKEAFLKGYSDTEACLYAEIGLSTLYSYQKDNPEYVDKKNIWKENQKIKAKNVINDALEKKDRDVAKWYLERKSKDEFSEKKNIDVMTGGLPITPITNIPEASKHVQGNNSDTQDTKSD